MRKASEQFDFLFQKIEQLEFLTIASFRAMQEGRNKDAEVGIHLMI